MNKKSQVSLFIIIGLVAVLAVGTLVYIGGLRGIKEDISAQSEDSRPVAAYITACLQNATDGALYLLGRQGGYIYALQGGAVGAFDDTLAVNWNDGIDTYRVPFEVFRITQDQISCRHSAPDYPFTSFSSTKLKADCLQDSRSLGPLLTSQFDPVADIISRLSRQPRSMTGGTLQDSLTSYISMSFAKCTDFSTFSQAGLTVTSQSPADIHVDITDEDVQVSADYPVEISSTTGISHLKSFQASANVRLKKVHSFVQTLKSRDSKDLEFPINLASVSPGGKQIIAEVADSKADYSIIKVTDEGSTLYGKFYSYYFARQNRAPALLPLNSLPLLANEAAYIAHINAGTNPVYYEPDEQAAPDVWLKVDDNPVTPNTCPPGEHCVRVTVSDGSLSDYQDVIVQ